MSAEDAPDLDLFAAELAFGLLDAAERAAAEERLADLAFAQMVARWRSVGETMLAANDEAPRPSLWEELARRLPANENLRVEPALGLATWPWQVATDALAAASLALGVFAWRQFERQTTPLSPPASVAAAAPPLTAVLREEDGRAVLAIAFDRDRGKLTVMPSSLSADAGAIELWIIPADGKPRSLGLVEAGSPRSRVPAINLRSVLAPGSTLAVTHEPEGGSPTGRPGSIPFLTGVLTSN